VLALVFVTTIVASAQILDAHSGPPFPIVSETVAGSYVVSIWTDPDTTDDGSAGGQFWVRIHPTGQGREVPAETRATVTIAPVNREGPARSASGSPVRGDITNQFAAVVMDREGPFAVRVEIDGPLGAATVTASGEATYDLRPPRWLFVVYLLPFVLAGLLWGRLLIRRRSGRAS
jgi:hypothetical protein